MPPSSTISSSSASASASSSATPSPSHDSQQGAVLGAVLGIVALVLLVGIAFITLRVRRRGGSGGEKVTGPFHGTALLDKDHPAAKIVPFGTPGTEAHLFCTFIHFALHNIERQRLSQVSKRSHTRARHAASHSTARWCLGLHRPKSTVHTHRGVGHMSISYVFHDNPHIQ